MANVISYGVAPRWGVYGSDVSTMGILINSISTTPNVSEYQTKGGAGQTIGWLAYDQWIDWSIQAALVGDGSNLPAFASLYTTPVLTKQSTLFFHGGGDRPKNVSICKTIATTQTAGDAYQVTLNGTLYAFDKAGENCGIEPSICHNPCLGTNPNLPVGTPGI